MERRILFTYDISKVSLQNVEQFLHSIRQTLLINLQPATVATSQAQNTTTALDKTIGKTAVPTAQQWKTTNNRRSTVDEDNHIEVHLEPSHPNDQRRTTSRTNLYE